MRMILLSIHSSPLGPAGARDTGGMSTYLRGLSGALGQAGHRIDIFTRAVDPAEEVIQEISPNVRLIHLDDGLGLLDKVELYPHCPTIAAALERFCRREGISYQIMFSHYWLSGCVGRILQQHWNIPHLIMFHTLGRAKNEACPDEHEPSIRIEEEEALARESDRIIVAAQLEKEKLLGYYGLSPAKVSVIPGGIDLRLFQPLDREEAREQVGLGRQKIILAVGRIEPVKGFDLLIRAVGMLPMEEKFKLVIVGGDDHSRTRIARLKETAAELGITEKVIFKGLINHDQLPLYYNAADVTVIASHYESFGLVALESIACGTPVIAGPVGIIPELLTPGRRNSLGRLVIERTPTAWAAAIRQVLLCPEPIEQADIDLKLTPYNWPAIAAQVAEECRTLTVLI